jgi:tyrocidine synthetase-3
MDIISKMNQLSPEQRIVYKKLLKQQGISLDTLSENRGKYSSIQPVTEKEYYAVSSSQKRLYTLNEMEGANIVYNMPGFLEAEGPLDVERFQWVFSMLTQRHEILRTSFDIIDGQIVQRIHDDVQVNAEHIWAGEQELEQLLNEFVRPFDLHKAPLMRVKIISMSEDRHVLAFDMHHIISDGVTMSIIIREIGQLYNGKKLEPLRLQYKDYAEWQCNQIKNGIIKSQEDYWLSVFEQEPPTLNIPSDYPRPNMLSFEGNSIISTVDSGLTAKLNALAKETGTTIYITLLAAYYILLSKYSGQEDIVVGSPVAGRTHADLADIAGMFVNTLAMRNYPKADKSFTAFLEEVKENTLKAFENQDYQFEMLVEKLNLRRDINRNPLFDTVFVMQNTGSKELHIDGVKFTSLEVENKISKFDLTLNTELEKDGITLDVEYCTKLFTKETIERLISHYINILHSITANPEIKIADIEILTAHEKEQILNDFNDNLSNYPTSKTIHEIFQEQAQRTPNNTAVVFKGSRLTYQQLNDRSNALARKLRGMGVKSETIVAIMTERSLDMITGIMAILKAGGAYMPIDPVYPQERVGFMLEDSGAQFLLSQSPFTQQVSFSKPNPKTGVCPVVLDLDDANLFQGDCSNLENINMPDHLAYIIYTSGTTGKPKGSMIEHRNVVRLLFHNRMKFDFSSTDVWTMFHSMSFDFSVWEMYGALLYGGKLVVVPRMTSRDPSAFLRLLKNEKVTVLNQTPTAFSNLIKEVMKSDEKELCVRYVIFGGEALKPAMLRDWKEKYPSVRLVNMYGITETTVHVTYKEITDYEIDTNVSNIGRPIPTLTAYIMDRNLKLAPIGVAGEICVGGEGVCRGYLERPELNRVKFIENPYKPGERLYRSGDLAKFLPNGEMVYMGRIDHQVKIRGHRIEPGEIENRLIQHTSVKEAVVLAMDDAEGQKYLCAYITGNGETTVEEIRKYLLNDLPEYMIPSFFIRLDSMPLTSNGKIDRKALPKPNGYIHAGEAYEAAQNEVEQKLVELWKCVLKADRIGVNDNFFSIGGDSIKAISLINAINNALGTNIKIKDIYKNQTIRSLAESLETSVAVQDELETGLKYIEDIQQEIIKDEKQRSMLPDDCEDFYPLSQIQNGMVFYSKLRPNEPIYHDQFLFNVTFKRFDLDTYMKTLQILMDRHPILKTVFDTEHFSMPLQIVRNHIKPEVLMDDLSELPKDQQENSIKNYLKRDLNDKFNFDNRLLWRMGVFKLDNENYSIVLSFQHAIMDGWSVSTFNKEFIQIFSRLIQGEQDEMQKLNSRYKDYVAINLTRRISEKTRGFWKEFLKGHSKNKLPFNISGKRISGMGGSRIIKGNLGKELLYRLGELSKELNCSVRDICLSACIYLISVLSNEKDVVMGLVTHDRPVIQDAERIIGCFLNTIPVRLQLDHPVHKKELIEAVKQYLKEVKEHELFLSDIAAITGNAGSAGNPIFDTLFNFTDFHVLKEVETEELLKESDFGLEIESNEMTNTLFDLEVSKTLDMFSMQIKYVPGYFYKQDIEMAVKLYKRVLEKFADDGTQVLNVEELISQEEKNEILYQFNNTTIDYPKEKTMHQLFEQQVDMVPDNTALIFEEKTLSYKELDQKANSLARMLAKRGVKCGDAVGLIARRGFDMIIGMLAILKAGAAYVPIDPEYPESRMAYIASNSKVSALLVEKGYTTADHTGMVLGVSDEFVIEIDHQQMDKYSNDRLNVEKDSKDLAYIIYTSGSTGAPKGVMIEHHSAVNLITWVNREFDVSQRDTLLFITSMCFDLSVYDIFGMLAAGGKIVIGKKEQIQNPKELSGLLLKEKVTFWDSVPSTMSYLISSLEEDGGEYIQENLRLVFMSGDWIAVNLPGRVKKFFPNARVISLGGATEGTVWSIYYPIEKVDEYQTSIPYGRPIDNNYFYILDDNQCVVPLGVAGELYIGGVGVARGYMNDEQRTKASFLQDRFRGTDGGMMYKTGDLGRMLPDRNIEFLGRKDHQVKIRGYRVELGEIESQLQKHERIKEAVAADRTDKDGNRYICAYIVTQQEITVQELKDYLLGKLPEYMVPSCFMNLEKLPLTPNGKIDRKSLPEPTVNLDTGREYEAPTNETEEKLAQIWQEVLEIDRVSIHDSFFDLGGHSLNATTLVFKIRKELNVEVQLREIFEAPTIKEIAKLIGAAEKSVYTTIEPAEKKEYYPLSRAQRRLYLLSQKESTSINYNTADAVKLEGEIDRQKLEQAFHKLIERHESLRTAFEIIDGQPVQIVHDKASFSVEYTRAKEEEIPSMLEAFVKPFHLEKAPLLRVKLISLDDSTHILAYDMHHIISDGVSMRVMIEEFVKLYQGESLRPLRIQYKDYSEWQNRMITKGETQKQGQYWLDEFKGEIPVLNLPADYARPKVQSFEGDSITAKLDKALTKSLDDIAARTGTTVYMVMLSAYSILLSKYSGQEDIIIGSPVAGRPHADLEGVIGMFVNTLAMRSYPAANKNYARFLEEVKDNALKAFENQDYPFDELVEKLDFKRDLSRNPLFDVMFVLQNVGGKNKIRLPGLNVMPYAMEKRVSRFDITLDANQQDGETILRFEYCTSLFKKKTIERLANDYIRIIQYIVENTDIKISDMVLESKYAQKESVISEEIQFSFQ